ncbi:MAG: hypothetical protein ICV52_19365 [Microcoleus sp. C1-bin4]|nr:hypothetical protein [Microcoleus sp. C1-bin4]
MVDFARTAADKAPGAARVFAAPLMTASEDFSHYRKVAPICFLNLGVGPGVANHNPKFNLDELALANGVKHRCKSSLISCGRNCKQTVIS